MASSLSRTVGNRHLSHLASVNGPGGTTVWSYMSVETEVRHGKNLVDAGVVAGVKHFVYSALDRAEDPVVDHWISKAAVDDYLKASGLPRTSSACDLSI